jgi:hypothetical protein
MQAVRAESNSNVCPTIRHRIEVVDSLHSLVYLPVYIAVYRYDGKPYTAVINAQTGSITGERPYGLPLGNAVSSLFSWWKRPDAGDTASTTTSTPTSPRS